MKNLKILFGMFLTICLIVVFPLISSAAATLEVKVDVGENYEKAYQTLFQINDFRSGNGRKELWVDDTLEKLAMQRAAELIVSFSHTLPQGDGTVMNRCGKINGEYFITGPEQDVYGAYERLLHVSGFTSNILDEKTAYCGIGWIHYGQGYFCVVLTSEALISQAHSGNGVMVYNKRNSYNIKVEDSQLKFCLNGISELQNGNTFYYGIQISPNISIENSGFKDIKIPISSSELNISSNTKDIFSVANNKICPLKTGSGSIRVALKNNSSTYTDIPVKIVPNTRYGSPKISISGGSSIEYAGRPVEPELVVTDCFDNRMKNNTDYRIEYLNNDIPGTGTANIYMLGNYADADKGSKDFYTINFTITGTKNHENNKETENGENAGNSDSETKESDKNTETEKHENTEIDKPNVNPTANNNTETGYKATKTNTKASSVKVAKTSITKLKTAGKKSFIVKWKKKKGVSGYQVQYALNKKFSKGKKTKNITKAKITSANIRKLKSRKTYYVRIRTYKKIKNKKYFSTWSKTRQIKIR